MANLRVVLDTNVLVSGFAYPASIPGQIVGAWRRGALDVVCGVLSLHISTVLPSVRAGKASAPRHPAAEPGLGTTNLSA